MNYQLVEITQFDDATLSFLASVYISTRWQEMQQAPWNDEQRIAFLTQQFWAQHEHYQTHFPEASYQLICAQQQHIGRLYLDERDDEIRIVDIALLPNWTGNGIGSSIISEIMAKAKQANKAVRIHVEKNNPAKNLYLRLGFKVIKDVGIYDLMQA